MKDNDVLDRLSRLNLVHPTELGTPLVEYFFERLEERDGVPSLQGNSSPRASRATQLRELNETIYRSSSLEEAIDAVRCSPYFEPYLASQTVVIEQIRNDVPADVTITFRMRGGESVPLESIFSTAHTDPFGLVVTDKRLAPAAEIRRNASLLQRRSFDLLEFADASQLAESQTYRAMFDDLRMSWHAIILDRNPHFTWVLIFWYRQLEGEGPGQSVEVMRAGFERIAEVLTSKCLDSAHIYEEPNSLARGLLVLDPEFRQLFRQNYAAEAMIQGLTSPGTVPLLRSSIYSRIRLEYERRRARGLEPSWTVGPYFHPTEVSGAESIRVSVHTYPTTEFNHYAGQHEIHLEELHTPHLYPPDRWWELPSLGRDARLGYALRELGAQIRVKPHDYASPPAGVSSYLHFTEYQSNSGFFIQPLSGIARPVWDIDLIGGRIWRYRIVSSGEIGRRPYDKSQLSQDRVWAISYYTNQIVGVIQAI